MMTHYEFVSVQFCIIQMLACCWSHMQHNLCNIIGLCTSDSAKANLFNQYFISVFTKEDTSVLPKLNFPTIAGFTFDNLSVSPSDVYAELSALDSSKACGPDGICPRLPKEGAAELAVPLTAIFNKSLADGALPLDWVSANISPVFKKANKHHVTN